MPKTLKEIIHKLKLEHSKTVPITTVCPRCGCPVTVVVTVRVKTDKEGKLKEVIVTGG